MSIQNKYHLNIVYEQALTLFEAIQTKKKKKKNRINS